jgi:UDP-glucose:(heptosyl)LPS alpha-1,3-glucosyltransferase
LAGDVYVNHGIAEVAMRARGHHRLRMLRNPLHLFTRARDRLRYSGRSDHKLVVNLVSDEERLLRDTYPRLSLPTVVIGNGVDVERFRPPTPVERSRARERLGLADGDRMILFIGNEFGRKGLPVLVEALGLLGPEVQLAVVGGSPELVAAQASRPATRRLGDRLRFAGAQTDPRPWLHAADALAMPSAYESYGLVVLEALACGVPVVATRTGCVPDVIREGFNGALVGSGPDDLAAGLRRALDLDPEQSRPAARTSPEAHSWVEVARRYLEVLTEAHAAQGNSVSTGRLR